MLHGCYIVLKYANPKPKPTAGKYDITGSRHTPSPTPIVEPVPVPVTVREDASGARATTMSEVHPFLASSTYATSSTAVSPTGQDGQNPGLEGYGGHGGDLPVYQEQDGGSQLKQAILRGDSKR
jgi:hypothetical protein